MTDVDLSSYKALYVQTARKYVTDMKTAEMALRSDKTEKQALESMFISAHSLKSQSQIMGYPQTGVLCGTIETLFRTIHDGANQLTDQVMNPLHEALEQISSSIDSIETTSKETELTSIIEKMKPFAPNTK